MDKRISSNRAGTGLRLPFPGTSSIFLRFLALDRAPSAVGRERDLESGCGRRKGNTGAEEPAGRRRVLGGHVHRMGAVGSACEQARGAPLVWESVL